MVLFTSEQALTFMHNGGYLIVFLAIFFEGPITAPLAGFAASLGYFNLYIVMVLAFFGNQIPDMLFFFVGKSGKRLLVKRLERRFGLTRKKMTSAKEIVRRHGDKAIWIVKLTPYIALPGILALATGGYSTKRFITFSALINLLLAITIVGLGYYFGLAYASITRYVDWTIAAIITVLILIIIAPFLYTRTARWLAQRIGRK